MDIAEFDKFATEYLETHERNIRLSGEGPDYFARYKIDEIARIWTRRRLPQPRTIVDFGSGIGASVPHLRRVFPDARITALDVSPRSLAVAESRFPGMAEYVLYDGRDLPLAPGSVDLIFSSCVFHHIDPVEHVGIFERLKGALSAGGRLAVFEHNPVNPVTRYIVSTCPFDENAILIPADVLRTRQLAAGFGSVSTAYTGFFPGPLRALRGVEPYLAWAPIGAQYYTLARV
jgi:hypothetical protein